VQNAHDALPDSRPHDQKLRISIVHVAPQPLSQAARVNVHRDIHAHAVQSLTGLKHSSLSQLPAHLEGVTLNHSSYCEGLLQTALRDPAVGLQPLKAVHRMMDEEDNAHAQLGHLLDVRHDLLDPVMSFQWYQYFLCHCPALLLISLNGNRRANPEGWPLSDARWQFN
jgi:hypothetical protein